MLTFLTLTAAILVATHSAAVMPEPAKCCIDRQFTGKVSELSASHFPITGSTVFEDSYSYFAYDFYRKKTGVEHHIRLPNGTEQVSKSLLDYNQDMIFVETSNTTCYAQKLGVPMETPCVPADAVYLGTSRIGYANEAIVVNTWEYTPPGTDIVYKRTFTKDGCVPVAFAYYGTVNGVPKNGVQLYSDYNPGIADPTILDIDVDPAYCSKASDFTTASSPNVGR